MNDFVNVPHERTEAMRLVPVRVLTETLYWMARAYERVHSMPRVSDTELANKIEAAKADPGRARDASPILSNSAAPVREEGGVGPGGYLVKDFADGWYWTPNAALDHASGAPVWSVADNRYETNPPALATREEAPASLCDHGHTDPMALCSDCEADSVEAPAEGAGEQCVKVCPQCEGEGEYADGVDEAACSTPCTRCGSNGWIVDLAALRARSSAPPSREDALRVAVEALEPFARAADGLDGLWSEDDWRWNDSVRSGVTVRDIRRARQALAALQAEQKGGA